MGSVEAAHGGQQFPLTPVLVWGRQNRKAPRPGIELGLQEPESDADPTEQNSFWDWKEKHLLGPYLTVSVACDTHGGPAGQLLLAHPNANLYSVWKAGNLPAPDLET